MKKFCTLVAAGVLCSLPLTVGAFEYTSTEGGFAVDIADRNIILAGENFFAAENRIIDTKSQKVKTTGLHSVSYITKEQLKENYGVDFTTEKFNADVENIRMELKKVKNPLVKDAYKYLQPFASGMYVNYSEDSELLAALNNINEKIAGLIKTEKVKAATVNGLKALMVENSFDNIGMEMKLPFKPNAPVDNAAAAEQGMEISISEDGYATAAINDMYGVKTKTYLLSANDNLYFVTGVAVDIGSGQEALQNLYKLDKKGFNKLNKEILQNLKFTQPQQAEPLKVNDSISGRSVTLPQDWFYTRMDYGSLLDTNKSGLDLALYSLVPERTLTDADKFVDSIDFDSESSVFKIDLSHFTMQNMLDLVTEGAVMMSGSLNEEAEKDPDFAKYLAEYKALFENPQLTKAMVNNLIADFKQSLKPENMAMVEKYVKAENFVYGFDINNYNGRFNAEADLKMHIPDIFALVQQGMQQKNVSSDEFYADETNAYPEGYLQEGNMDLPVSNSLQLLDNNLVPFDCYFKNQFYFDRNNKFNNLLYFTKGSKAEANKIIMQQFDDGLYLY